MWVASTTQRTYQTGGPTNELPSTPVSRGSGDHLYASARQVAADLAGISSTLERLIDDLPARRRHERGRLIDIADRIERCHHLLSAELDRPDPDLGFLRKAIALSVLSAKIAATVLGGFAASEVSQEFDLRSPLERVEASALNAGQAERDLFKGWSVVGGDRPWQEVLARERPSDLRFALLSLKQEDTFAVAMFSIDYAPSIEPEEASPTIVLSTVGYDGSLGDRELSRHALASMLTHWHPRDLARALDSMVDRR